MKNPITLVLVFFAVLSLFGQAEAGKDVVIDTEQTDDIYIAGEQIELEAVVKGDVVAAGGTIILNDSIYGDFISAGGDLTLKGPISDDVRVAGGKLIIDSEVGDDLVVFGGEVLITEKACIKGKLLCFAGKVTVDGEVVGALNVRGGAIFINGTIRGPSKIVGEDIVIGSTARFYDDVEYYTDDGKLNFNGKLVNANAQFNEDLVEESSQLSLRTLGTASLKLWAYYVLSAFLVILVLHALFKNAFSSAVEGIENNLGKSFGFGLLYLFGIPFLILFAFLMVIGIPIGLFATGVFVFSLFFGHLVAAILIAYYLRNKNEKDWGFWGITLLALGCAVLLRALTIIPFVGIIISIVVLSITYGALSLQVFRAKKQHAA